MFYHFDFNGRHCPYDCYNTFSVPWKLNIILVFIHFAAKLLPYAASVRGFDAVPSKNLSLTSGALLQAFSKKKKHSTNSGIDAENSAFEVEDKISRGTGSSSRGG
ncbi:unnamed protein product [Arabidopsis thaliana]|uniref:(thale cress) hypothetical protein n=1 Tax=Arabidopsis thaliana TaxID=3702 RepID=A0A7G2E1G8_ARATH|nr:unnamed protein product [Arabidopsis thaliana]